MVKKMRCLRVYNNTKDEKRGTSMHQIPFFDDQRPEAKKRRRQWIAFVDATQKNWTASKYSVICSVHFTPADFSRLSYDGQKYQQRLKKDEIIRQTAEICFWSLIVEKRNLMDRDTSFLVFRIITPINNAFFYHFLAQFLSSQ